MTNDANMMRRLLWKDAMTIKPMMIALVVGVVALNLVFLIATNAWGETRHSVDAFVSIWILMPNLVALGAPALLVGSEEESGTLTWLRTLPVRWQQIAAAKFIAALAAVTVAWLVSSLAMATANVAIPFVGTHISDTFLSLPGVLHLAFFSLLLLLCGFVTAYLFRSPVTALVMLVPLILVVNVVAIDVGRWILSGHVFFTDRAYTTDGSKWVAVVMLAIITLIVLFFVQRWLAGRRLNRPAATLQNHIVSPTAAPYRPPARMGLDQPSPVAALLWQQSQQLGWPGFSLVLVTAAFLIFYRIGDLNSGSASWGFLVAIAPVVVALGSSWLGGLSFYGDNVRRRCAFLADRGISPTLIWWTRLLVPSLLCGALVLLQLGLIATMDPGPGTDLGYLIAGMIVVLFAFGQLVGQWISRATLTFFAAPTYPLGILMASSVLLPIDPVESKTTLLVVPVLLFASWRLTSRWLTGRIDAGYHGRVVAYTALAMLLPTLAVIGHRIATIPPEMTPWRTEMLSFEFASPDGVAAHEVFANAPISNPLPTADWDWESVRRRMKQELAHEGEFGTFISRVEIDSALESDEIGDEARRDAIAILLKWAAIVREEAAAGKHELSDLEFFAESIEEDAVNVLSSMSRDDPRWAELVDMIPDAELRYQSRKATLIKAWRDYQPSGRMPKHYRLRPESGGPPDWTTSWEQQRLDRAIDQATRFTLEQLDGSLPIIHSSPYREREVLWTKAGMQSVGRLWTSDYERRIADLRRSYSRD